MCKYTVALGGNYSLVVLVSQEKELGRHLALITFGSNNSCLELGQDTTSNERDSFLRLGGLRECGKAICVCWSSHASRPGLVSLPSLSLGWELHSSWWRRQLAARPLPLRCPQSWQRSQLRRGFPRCKTWRSPFNRAVQDEPLGNAQKLTSGG